MPAIGLTGGVGTGKSSFLRMFEAVAGCDVFDADRCVHELLAGDASVLDSIRSEFGDAVFDANGAFSRPAMRQIVYDDPSARKRLEAILHPVVRSRWVPLAREARGSKRILILDIPLLYETAGEAECDCVAVVACGPETQRQRLIEKRGLALGLIQRMIDAQLDLAVKADRADHVVWNDGSLSALEEQARLFAAYLGDIYG